MRISTSMTTFFCPVLFSFFYWSMNIANRITSRMAFNIFSTSINICSLARYFSSSSSPYGDWEKFLYPMWVHTRVLWLHRGPLKYTYVRVHGSQSKRDLLDRLFGSRAEERIKCCRTSTNMAPYLLAQRNDRSQWSPPIYVHTHVRTHVCVTNADEGWHR